MYMYFFNSVFPRLLTHQHLHTLLWRDAADEVMGDPTNEVSVDHHITPPPPRGLQKIFHLKKTTFFKKKKKKKNKKKKK